MNLFKTIILMSGLTILLVLLGGYYGGQQGAIMALLFAGGLNFVAYWFSDKIALMSYKAQPVTEAEAPELYHMVRTLATRASLPMPKVYLIPSASPNAFATGRDPQHAAVAVTQGIIQILNRQELEGVIAHELAHVQNRDILIATMVATIAGAITMIARMAGYVAMFGGYGGDRNRDRGGGGALGMILIMILAPIAALLIKLWISRTREYSADSGGAQIAGNPQGLASALEKLQTGVQMAPMNANPASSHLFIVNPLSGKSLMSLFSTHPPIKERVAKLRAMGRG
ncbi:zinc metalloprotease HtpX [candidate division TA06 bacterium]|uniref:Protease HtpX homolog n=1 Tax=candidate division TA06 bacterium TaxID=2250710 RepID=A0A933IE39_UNCT6|nr:zinc metalloprotease HtpX [candidate division TA06 bacterium]